MDINPIRLIEFAKTAADKCLAGGVTLNEAIAKIAEKFELNPMQIQRVAEYANHEVQGKLYKQSSDKNFTFDLADPNSIIQQIRGMEGQTKIAAVDVVFAATAPPKAARLTKEAFDRFLQDPEEAFRRLKDTQFFLEKLAQHVVKFRQELGARQLGLHGEIAESISKLAGMGKEHIITNRGQLSDLLKFACIKDPECGKMYLRIFENIKQDMMKLGAPVDKSLIADDLEIPDGTLEIINGGHTLAIELDTLKNKISEEDKMAKRIRLLDTFGDAVVDKMRIIRTPEEADQSILEDTWRLSKKAEAGVDEFLDQIEKDAVVGKLILIPASAAALLGGGKFLEEATEGATKSLKQPYKEGQKLRSLTR